MTLSIKYFLEVRAASLSNNRGDIDRINKSLIDVSGADEITWPLGLIPVAFNLLRSSDGRITVTCYHDKEHLNVIAVEPGDTSKSNFGLAVDLGTTVVAAELIDLNTGKPVASAGEVNGQVRYGEDLLTRLHFAGQGGAVELHNALLDTVNGLIAGVCSSSGVEPDKISAASVAGNTSMTHLFLGLDPSAMRFEPYVPILNHAPKVIAKDIGLDIIPHAFVYAFPNVGAYFGGDLIAGAIASGIAESDDISLLLDIGTNVEAILGNRDWLLAIAGSAGPALEGGVAECARRAEPGAIERVAIDPATFEPSVSAIDDALPVGLCGSGLIDTVAQLHLTGLIDATGRFVLDKKTERFKPVNGRMAYMLVEADDVNGLPPTYITEKDIQSLLETKAAMVSALTVLLDSVGLKIEDVQRIYTAGSFGIHLSVESATAIGLYPGLPADRFITLGNGSLRGAREVLLNAAKIEEAERIADRITYLELNVHPEFMEIFRSAKYI